MPNITRKGVFRFGWLYFILRYCAIPIMLGVYLLAIDWHEVCLTLFSTDDGVSVHPIAQILIAPAQSLLVHPILSVRAIGARIFVMCVGIVGLPFALLSSFLWSAVIVTPILLFMKITFGLKYQKAKLLICFWPQNKWANNVIALANQDPVPPVYHQEIDQLPYVKPFNPPAPVNPHAIKRDSSGGPPAR